MTASQTTRLLHKILILPLILIAFILTSCAPRQQVSATPAQSGPPVSPSLPTEIVPVHPGTIAFVSVAPGEVDDIYIIQTDGTGLTRLTETRTSAEDPAWSPDGSKIAYDSCPQNIYDLHRQYDVWVMNADGSQEKQLTHGPLGGTFPSWSPDGTRIAFSTWFYPQEERGPAQIYVMDADGNNSRQVTSGPANDLFPTWTPDGNILFLRKEGAVDSTFGDIFAVDPDGIGLVRLTTMRHVGGFALSPDGTRIALHDTEHHRIVLLPADARGAPVTLVDTDFGYDFVQIAWSPDGEALALARVALEGIDGRALHIVNADGSGLTTIANAEAVLDVAWRPR